MMNDPDALGDWMMRRLQGGLGDTISKAGEYGFLDLAIMGDTLGRWLDLDTPQLGQQGACAFYLLGKTGRVLSALEAHRHPSADTWWDATVYSMFGLRLCEEGRL